MPEQSPQPAPPTTCYRHPDRSAGVRCQRCERYICPSCMSSAQVGFQCPECVKAGGQKVITGRNLKPTALAPASVVLIGLNVAMFVIGLMSGGDVDSPLDGFDEQLYTYGPHIRNGEWWRIITGTFLHAGLFHLAVNMWALWVFGQVVERALGTPRYLLIYLTSGIGGSLGVMLLSPDTPTVGASGAIYGLLGCMFVLQLRRGINPWYSGLASVIVINLAITFIFSAYISVGGHLGGIVTGAAVTWLISEVAGDRDQHKRFAMILTAALGALLFVAALLAARQAMVIPDCDPGETAVEAGPEDSSEIVCLDLGS